MADDSLCLAFLQRFMQLNGGPRGGWDDYDHGTFLKFRNKHKVSVKKQLLFDCFSYVTPTKKIEDCARSSFVPLKSQNLGVLLSRANSLFSESLSAFFQRRQNRKFEIMKLGSKSTCNSMIRKKKRSKDGEKRKRFVAHKFFSLSWKSFTHIHVGCFRNGHKLR